MAMNWTGMETHAMISRQQGKDKDERGRMGMILRGGEGDVKHKRKRTLAMMVRESHREIYRDMQRWIHMPRCHNNSKKKNTTRHDVQTRKYGT